jgi:hypothetical protein
MHKTLQKQKEEAVLESLKLSSGKGIFGLMF